MQTVAILDFSMKNFEGGQPRVYTEVAPTITGRIYKEPWLIVTNN